MQVTAAPEVAHVLLGSLLILQIYGSYYRKLSKRVQSALAEANAVAEEVLSAMATVRPVLWCGLALVPCGMGLSLCFASPTPLPPAA